MNAHVKTFESLLDYQQWVNENFPQAIRKTDGDFQHYFTKKEVERQIKADDKWFGKNTSYRELFEGVTTYKDPKLIEELFSMVESEIDAETTHSIKTRKVRYNGSGLGVFSFDRAAMGLYRMKEYYSPSMDKVVDERDVEKADVDYVLKTDGSPVLSRWEEKQDGSPKIRTSSKYIFAYFPKVKAEKKAVEIFISSGGHAHLSAEEFLYSGISAIVIAQLLEKARIRTKINVIVGTYPDRRMQKAYAGIIPVKKYEETLDVNLIALLTSDPRFYRYHGFKGLVCLYDHFNSLIPHDAGMGIREKYDIQRVVEQSGYLDNSSPAMRLYMGRVFGKKESLDEINGTIQSLAKILNEP